MAMKMRKVLVADRVSYTGDGMQVQVPESRYMALEAAMREKAGTLFTGDSYSAMTGRRMTARDAGEALAFSVSELAFVEQDILARLYEPPQGFDFVPISYKAGPWAESIVYRVKDMVGNARWADSLANDTPTTDVSYASREFAIAHGKAGYEYSQQELRTSAYLRRPLDVERLDACQQDYRRFMSEVFLLGSTEKNFTGFYNNALIASAATPSAANWSGGATVAQVISDFGFGMYTCWVQSQQNVVPNRVIVPKLAYQWMSTTPISTANGSNITVLNFLLQNNLCNQKRGQQLRIDPGYDNSTAGSGSTPRTVFYDQSEETLVGHIPMPLQFLAPQFVDTMIKIPGEFRGSGVEWKRPTGGYYMDGT